VCIFLAQRPTDPPPPSPRELSAPNPLTPAPSLELENLTWIDIRDRIRTGTTRILVPTGGIEQNGPFVSVSKHNHIARAVSVRVAELLGSTLVAPVVAFVPEGTIDPPSGHMLFPGTLSLRESTFQLLLEEIGASLAAHGFTEIVLLGDSADSQWGLEVAAAALNERFGTRRVRAMYIPEFYNYPEVRRILLEKGIREKPEEFHEELAFSLQLMAIDPSTISYERRIAAGQTSLGGFSLLERDKLIELGKEIVELRAQTTAAAIKAREQMLERTNQGSPK
jgi:creatinine amidohydrolase